MTTRRLEDTDSHHQQQPQQSPLSKRPRLFDMTNSSDQCAAQNGQRGPGLKPPRSRGGSDGVAAAAAAPALGPLGRRGMVDRTQFVRLLEQALSSLGFSDVAEQLECASGIPSQPPQVCVGEWGRGGTGVCIMRSTVLLHEGLRRSCGLLRVLSNRRAFEQFSGAADGRHRLFEQLDQCDVVDGEGQGRPPGIHETVSS